MDSNKFYSFYMKGWDEPCLGIIQSIGDEWILIKKNHSKSQLYT